MSQRTVLITGGSKGLGLSIVEDCLAAGFQVATCSRSKTARMDELATAHPDRFHYFAADLADPQAPERAVAAVAERFGGFDCLVNNAAIARDGILATMPESQILEVVQVNLTSVLLLTRACSRQFLKLPRAAPKAIVTISSIVGLTGFRGLSVYSSTKSALLGMTRCLARELGPANVTVNAVLPGFLITEMSGGLDEAQRRQIERRTPLGRLGEGKDIAPAVRFLLGEQARFITGQCIVVDGGASC